MSIIVDELDIDERGRLNGKLLRIKLKKGSEYERIRWIDTEDLKEINKEDYEELPEIKEFPEMEKEKKDIKRFREIKEERGL